MSRKGRVACGGVRWRSTSVREVVLLFFVPLVDKTGHFATEFAEFVDVVNHLGAGETGDRIILAEIDRLLGADLFAESAIDATDHVDIECLWAFLHLAPALVGGDFFRMNSDCARRANEFAKLAAHTLVSSKLIAHEGRSTAIPVRHLRVPLLLGVLHGDFCLARQEAEHVFERDQKARNNRGQVDLFGQSEARTRDGVSHKVGCF